jgi:succinate-semialdehyde dehydrogenase/glutarate-semialdehyde dehydrogenase
MFDPSALGAAYINGRWIDGARRFAVTNPATGAAIAEVADLGPAEAQTAIDAAAAALPAWAARPADERGQMLRRWAALILEHQEALARLLTAEQGKPLAEARGEVAFGASFLIWFAEEARRVYGEVIPSPFGGKRYLTLRQPSGVAAAITPWNFPIGMLARKLAPALAVGCTMVAKPAEETPLCALAMAALGEQAGLPPGVFNVVTTLDAAGAGGVLCASPVVRVLSFTGSTEVGRILYAQCAPTIKKLALELGGNAPVLVFDDADCDSAIDHVIAAKFRNAGQTCVCANRVYVQDGIHDRFVAALTGRAAAMRVGAGDAEGSVIGPLINAQAVQKVERLVADCLAKGARLECGGAADNQGPLFYRPTVLSGITPGMDILREEVFGPVAPVVRFADEQEAIAAANDSEVGLAAYGFTQNAGRAWRLAERLQAGIVAINDGLPSNAVAPFGGIKQSGLGREGGRQGLDEYVDVKYVCMGIG